MYHKIEQHLVFNTKRNRDIVTPCCGKSNKDLKFVSYKEYPEIYGYCHSCGNTKFPPSIYKDDFGNEFYWNVINKKFESVLQLYDKTVLQNIKSIAKGIANSIAIKKYIDFQVVIDSLSCLPENNLLIHLRSKYGNTKVDNIKKLYYIGNTNDGGTIFWNINEDQKAQKSKICYYRKNGKRTTKFKVPYKNKDGYYGCLFGEHLLFNNELPIVLVESEKTALVCAIHFPNFNWLSYGGINGMTNDKMKVLSGENILIVPDLSENAITIATKKAKELRELNISAKIWDMRNGLNDNELKESGFYNCDLEDFIDLI
ncbi:DUF6371 domain-containing protein [Polaribacter glomeratus]|uniref:DUF6371 domain-containing protein n=1 Tax=Polaribacter glomeratus TaxID=102 RepID=A0A2S7WFN2_9FLAO|nr:DUF6371 domain-containing protein [Polaribacter glomeratus]PQJ76404.1 hypothetical protein BTO16_10850 [Polaribacter glomeratus]TXD65537.1 hypothetical protein ESX12_10155 [Polaribacter glomeratus]